MINFRYHVVSLAAVFLALAIGLVVGTAAANGPIADNLKDQIGNLTAEKEQQRNDLDQARLELEKNEDFANELAPILLSGKLAGKRVLLAKIEGTDKAVDKVADGVAEMLTASGAKLTGRVTVRERFTAPGSKDELLDLAETSAPPSISGALPNQGNGVDTSAALLASVLLGKTGAPAVEGARTVLSAYEERGFLSLDGDFGAPAEAVILITGAAPTGKDAKERGANVLTVATRFDLAGRLVVGGLSATGLVQAVRDDASIAKSVSTVDNTVSGQGQIAVVLAVVERIAGKTGHYGIGNKATALLPKPASVRDGS